MPVRGKPGLIKILLAVVVLVLLLTLLPGKTEKNTPPPRQEEGKEIKLFLAYYDKGWGEKTRGLPSFKQHHGSLDMVCPNWYGINSAGGIVQSRGEIEPEINKLSRQEEIKILPLVTGFKGSSRVLADKELTERAAANIAGLVKEKDYNGVNIDLEYIPGKYAAGLTRLVQFLAAELQPEDKIVAVSVFPKVDFPERLHGLHNYEELAAYADYICLMAYDRHSPATGPGPVAPLPWVKANIEKALEEIPPGKLILAMGAYGYDWNLNDGVEALSINQAQTRANSRGVEIAWAPDSAVPYFSYRHQGARHEVWFENEKSAALKASLVREYDLAGLAFWRLGFENKSFMARVSGY